MLTDILTSLIEVGIGIAGFSSIVVTLSRHSVTTEMKQVFVQLWIQSAGIIIFSAVPLLLAVANFGPDKVYTVASYLYGAFLAIAIPSALYLQRSFIPKTAYVALAFPVAVLANGVFFGEAWLYILILILGALGAFIAFFRLIQLVWSRSERT